MPLTYTADASQPTGGGGSLTYLNDAVAQPPQPKREVSGVWDSLVYGSESSATRLMTRGKMPDLVLDPHHSKWYEEALSGLAGVATDLPLMMASAIPAGLGGTAVAGPVGGALASGAAGMAVPREIRESLMRAYQSGEADSSADWLTRTGIILRGLKDPEIMKLTAQDAAIGAATMGMGMVAGRIAEPLVGATGQMVARTAAEAGTMVLAPAALDGRLPEMRDIANAAVVIAGLKGAHLAVGKIADIYAKTGVRPEQVVADAKADPALAAELTATSFEDVVARKKANDAQLSGELQGMSYEELDAAYQKASSHNLQVEREAVGKFLGADKLTEFEALKSRRAKDAFLDNNLTDAAQDYLNAHQVNEGMIESFRKAANDFDTGSAVELGRSIAVLSRNVDDPNFMNTAEGFTFKNALRFANEQGWSLDDVLKGMRQRSTEWAGNDAPELFSRIFKAATDKPTSIGGGTSGKTISLPDLTPKQPGETEIPRAYKPLAEAEMLKNALPDPLKVAEVMANPTGAITEGKQPNHINYTYSETPQDVQALRAKIAETFKTEIEAERGKESWQATQEKAIGVIADRLAGMSDDQRATLSSMSFSDLAAQSMAVEALAQKAAFNAREAAAEIARKGDQATPEDAAKLAAAIEQSALLHAVDQGNGAEIARALNSRKAAKERGELAEAMSDVLAQYGKDPHVLARMVLGLHTTAEITKFAKEASKATNWEKFVEAWKAGILSGPVTHMANLLGNGTFMAMRPVIDTTAAMIGPLLGMKERVSAAEPMARIVGNMQGAIEAILEAGAMLKVEYGEAGVKGVAKAVLVGKEQGAVKGEQFRKAIEGTKGDIIRLPFRALSVADEFFKTMNERGEAYALAVRKSVGDGHNVLSREFRESVASMVQNDPAISKAVSAAGLRFTFNTGLGEAGQAVQELVRKGHLQLLVPFIRTPANIFKEMIRLTPLAPSIKEWRTAYEAGGAEKAKAISEVVMGTAISGVVAAYALSGGITGQGSPDPNKRRAAIAAGWQPYSLKIGNKYYSYQRLQPVGTLIGMAADLTEVWENAAGEENNKVATMLSVAFANAVTQQTFLQGVTSIVQVLADPQRYGDRFVQNYAGSIVPAIIAQPTAMADPLQREIGGIIDAIKARIPGARGTLQPKINELTGQPVTTKEMLGGASPIKEATKSEDKVLSEAARLGVGVAKAPKSVELSTSGLDSQLGKMELTPEQRTIFASASGKLAHKIMDNLVNSPSWDSRPDVVKRRIYATVLTESRKAGASEAVSPEQRMAKAREIAASLRKQMQQARPQ